MLQAVTALLSGEMRDTAELGPMTKHAAENYLPQPSRAHMFRSWGAVIGMLPAGGNRVSIERHTRFDGVYKGQRVYGGQRVKGAQLMYEGQRM